MGLIATPRDLNISGLILCIFLASDTFAAQISSNTINGEAKISSWKALRDFRIVKQNLDYSCGAASVATILNGFYGHNLTESEILEVMEQDGAASFEDLAQVVSKYGFKGGGIALSFRDLKQLSVPAIAYLKYRGDDHFSVIRGIRSDGIVHLADPSWGNRKFTQAQFKKMWETRDDEVAKGKILLIVPKDQASQPVDSTFFKEPNGWALSLQSIPLGQ